MRKTAGASFVLLAIATVFWAIPMLNVAHRPLGFTMLLVRALGTAIAAFALFASVFEKLKLFAVGLILMGSADILPLVLGNLPNLSTPAPVIFETIEAIGSACLLWCAITALRRDEFAIGAVRIGIVLWGVTALYWTFSEIVTGAYTAWFAGNVLASLACATFVLVLRAPQTRSAQVPPGRSATD